MILLNKDELEKKTVYLQFNSSLSHMFVNDLAENTFMNYYKIVADLAQLGERQTEE